MSPGRKKPSIAIFWRNPQFSPLKPVGKHGKMDKGCFSVNIPEYKYPFPSGKVSDNMILSLNFPKRAQLIRSKMKKEVYNFKSQNTPPFEADLFKLIRKVRFKREHNNFQMILNKDIKDVKKFLLYMGEGG